MVLAFASAKNHVSLLAFIVCSTRCIALLFWAICSLLMCWSVLVERSRAQLSLSLLGPRAQLGIGCIIGKNIFLRWLPIYVAYLNFNV